MSDERHNLPSASGLPRIMACPGSWNAERAAQAERPGDKDSQEATRGRLIHDAYAGSAQAEAQLTSDEADFVLAKARRWEAELCAEFFGGRAYTVTRERRLFLHQGLTPIFSGKFDFLAESEDGQSALCLDLKTGWDDELPDSAENWQLRAYAVLAARHKRFQQVGVAILAPRTGQPTLCIYDAADLARAERATRAGLDFAARADALRIPGIQQCKYCHAAGTPHCPESQAVSAKLAVRCDAALLSPEERGARIELLKLGVKLAEAELDTYKEMLTADPNSVAGYRLKPGRILRPVTDPLRCYQQAAGHVSPEEMMACCEVSKTKLEEKVRAKTGHKGKALDAEMAKIFDGCLGEKQSAPTLEKIATELAS